MKLEITKELSPCPACGHRDTEWSSNHHRYVSLKCKNCNYEMWPFDEYESEDEFYEEWDNLCNLDKMIEDCEKEIKEIKYRLLHYKTEKEKIDKIRKQLESSEV